MHPELFRDLSGTEIEKFIDYAKANYKLGEPIPEVWHPVSQVVAARMNLRAWETKYRHRHSLPLEEICF